MFSAAAVLYVRTAGLLLLIFPVLTQAKLKHAFRHMSSPWECGSDPTEHDNTSNYSEISAPWQKFQTLLDRNSTPTSRSQVDKIARVAGAHALQDMLQRKDLLIIFFHPGCPSCYLYLLRPSPPIEQFAEELRKDGGPSTVAYDLSQHGLPMQFDNGRTVILPSLRLGSDRGMVSIFKGSPFNFRAVREWIASHDMVQN